ncbi:MAG: response regulator transcription factor [Actinobacteria bacterium]|nr:MAG: response regulator transcription factor [Actinomycetota bacterium]
MAESGRRCPGDALCACPRARCEHRLEHRSRSKAPLLSPRELQVLWLGAQGLSVGEIAEQLSIRPATVKTHFERAYLKLGAHDRAAAVASAFRLGLIR